MLSQHTPLILCTRCPACGAKPGAPCREFNTPLVAHLERQEAAQEVFEREAARLRSKLGVIVKRADVSNP